MPPETDQDSERRKFRLSDLLWVICFAGLAILLIFAAISLWDTWKISTLSRQFFSH